MIDLLKEHSEVIKLFKEDIKIIENSNSSSILCFRGDSKENQDLHNNFFKNELAKIFIIGSKSRSNYIKNEDDLFEFYAGGRKKIIENLEELIRICNEKIASKPDSHCITGKFSTSFKKYLFTLNKKELEHWRLFFISFLHNNGKGRSFKKFKNYSPFTSLTYGKRKGRIARRFAMKSKKDIDTGIIYIVSVNNYYGNYIKTADMIKVLKQHGINWYPDVHSELMLINGIFPHDILGIMEVKNNRTPLLIINPWLFKEYLDGKRFSLTKGIPINQKYFKKWIKEETDFKRYSWRDNMGNQSVEEVNQESKLMELDRFN